MLSPLSAPPSSAAAGPSSSAAPAIKASGPVDVLYAGSLANLMEHDLGPAFNSATGGTFQGFAAGSTALVSDIKGKVKQGDVFISASTDANTGLIGAKNGKPHAAVKAEFADNDPDYVRRFYSFANRSMMVADFGNGEIADCNLNKVLK